MPYLSLPCIPNGKNEENKDTNDGVTLMPPLWTPPQPGTHYKGRKR